MLEIRALWSTVKNASQSALVNLPKAVARKEWTTMNIGVVAHGMNLSNPDGLGGGVCNLLLDDGFIHGDDARRLTGIYFTDMFVSEQRYIHRKCCHSPACFGA